MQRMTDNKQIVIDDLSALIKTLRHSPDPINTSERYEIADRLAIAHANLLGRIKKPDVNEELSKAVDENIKKETTVLFEKLVAVVIRPTFNSYAELFRDLSFGVAGISLAAVIIEGMMK